MPAIFSGSASSQDPKGKFDAALASSERALPLRRDRARRSANCGGDLHLLKRYKEALSNYELSVALLG